jgi:hypothetical protein
MVCTLDKLRWVDSDFKIFYFRSLRCFQNQNWTAGTCESVSWSRFTFTIVASNNRHSLWTKSQPCDPYWDLDSSYLNLQPRWVFVLSTNFIFKWFCDNLFLWLLRCRLMFCLGRMRPLNRVKLFGRGYIWIKARRNNHCIIWIPLYIVPCIPQLNWMACSNVWNNLLLIFINIVIIRSNMYRK